jgi:oligosaccharide repeat unit polymerase
MVFLWWQVSSALVFACGASLSILGEWSPSTVLPLLSLFLVLYGLVSLGLLGYVASTFLNPFVLFFLAAFVFHSGREILSIVSPFEISSQFPIEHRVDILLFICVCLWSLFTGGALAWNQFSGADNLTKVIRSTKNTYAVGTMMLLVSFAPFIFYSYQRLGVFLSESYMGLYNPERDSYGLSASLLVVASMAIPGAIFMLAGSGWDRKKMRLPLAFLCGSICLDLFMGNRGGATMVAVAVLWLLYELGVRIKTRHVLALGVVAMISFPVIAMTRVNMNLSHLLEWGDSFFAFAIVNEMGGTADTVGHTMNLVPEVRDFENGVVYWDAITTIVPNLFWDIHPAKLKLPPAQWLTQTVAPATAEIGGGLGYSFIAESYLNFGALGFLYCGLFGFFVVGITNWSRRYNVVFAGRIAIVGVMMSMFLQYARGDVFLFVRPVVWFGFLPYFVVLVLDYLDGFRGSDMIVQGVRHE